MNTKSAELRRPPLGLVPKFIIQRRRVDEILGAMIRYNQSGENIPREWATELIELIDDLQGSNKQSERIELFEKKDAEL